MTAQGSVAATPRASPATPANCKHERRRSFNGSYDYPVWLDREDRQVEFILWCEDCGALGLPVDMYTTTKFVWTPPKGSAEPPNAATSMKQSLDAK
jgi:hypothetical protein